MNIIKAKAQIQSQIFVYVIAIVVVGLILLFGYNAVKNFGERAEEVALIQFEKDMKSTFHVLSTSYGKVEIKKVQVPGGFDTVCFHDLRQADPNKILFFGRDTQDNPIEYPIITESVLSDAEKNLFLVGGLNIESFNVGNIRVTEEFSGTGRGSPGFICFDVKQGRVEFKLFGEGREVLIKPAE